MKVKFTGDYRAVLQRAGRLETVAYTKGQEVDLDDDVADFITRDCPGIMTRAKGTTRKARKGGDE